MGRAEYVLFLSEHDQAQKLIAPLIGSEPLFSVEVGEYNPGMKWYAVRYLWGGRKLGEIPVAEELVRTPTVSHVGYDVGFWMHEALNQAYHTAVRQAILSIGKEVLHDIPNTQESDSLENMVQINRIIGNCCAIVYSFHHETGSIDRPELEEKAELLDFLNLICPTEETWILSGLMSAAVQAAQVAAELYRKKGYGIISELFHLPYEGARDIINETLGRDVIE